MGLIVNASRNSNDNPLIYGSNTYQSGSGQPIEEDPLVNRVIVERAATDIEIFITPVSDKVVDDAATESANSVVLAAILSNSGLTAEYNSTLHRFEITGDSIDQSQADPLLDDNVYHDDINAGLDSIYGNLTFVFVDTTTEEQPLFITCNRAKFKVEQTDGTNTLIVTYRDSTIDRQDPLDDWGVAYKGTVKYEYSLDEGTTWLELDTVQVDEQGTKTLDNAYQNMLVRATRTVLDENNNVIYESVSDDIVIDGPSETLVLADSFDMTDEVPTPSFALSDLYCDCGMIDLKDNSVYQNRKNWMVAVFTRSILEDTPFYRWFEPGNELNFEADSEWKIMVPFNGAYTFRVLLVKAYSELTEYGQNDWAYNSVDGNIYVSLQPNNLDNPFSDLVNWRRWNNVTDIETVFTKTTNTATGTFAYANTTKNVTCNQQPEVCPKFDKSCESSCSTIVFEDITGVFDFSDNPYGYGPPHYRRDAYAHVPFLVNKKSDGSILSYLPATYNPLSSMLFLFDIPKDGWYRLYVYQVKIYDATKRYYMDEVVFSTELNAYLKSIVPVNVYPLTNSQAWKPAEVWEDFRDGKTFGDYYKDEVVTCNGRKTLNDIGMSVIDSKCDCKSNILEKYDLLRIYLSGACNAEAVFDFEGAQRLLESIPKYCSPYMGTTKCNCGC